METGGIVKIPDFPTNKELFKFLVENKETLIRQKKAILKHGDGYLYAGGKSMKGDGSTKAAPVDITDKTELKVIAIINTTNWMDSHKDVHLPGLWDKSLKENPNILHVQEHKSWEFEKIISEGDELKAYTEFFKWKELGFNAQGQTEALVFDSKVLKDRNEYMFKQYAKGRVKNHSVGMRYVKIILCINCEDYGAEYEAWEKYYPEIINKEAADDCGYFWAVKEAKVIEGSAVPIGSNIITPTQSVEAKNNPEPSQDTPETGSRETTSTDKQKSFFNSILRQ